MKRAALTAALCVLALSGCTAPPQSNAAACEKFASTTEAIDQLVIPIRNGDADAAEQLHTYGAELRSLESKAHGDVAKALERFVSTIPDPITTLATTPDGVTDYWPQVETYSMPARPTGSR